MSHFSKIIYAILFLALVLQPHFVDHVSIFPKAYVESAVTLIILAIAYLTYRLHQWDVRQQEHKNMRLELKLGVSEKKLLESFKYIGLVNRRLPLLKNLSSDLLAQGKLNRKEKETIFHKLLATAVRSIAQVEWGIFRFIDVASQHTTKEFLYSVSANRVATLKISNKRLISVGSDNGLSIIRTSDQDAPIQNFLILPDTAVNSQDEYPILRTIVDQAQLFFLYLASSEPTHVMSDASPSSERL